MYSQKFWKKWSMLFKIIIIIQAKMVTVHWDNRILEEYSWDCVLVFMQTLNYFICPSESSQSYLFLSYLLGEESKVPNMQEVVRKLLNALYHSVMNHVVRQLTFFSSDRAFRFFYVAFPEVKWQWITTISVWLCNKGWGGPLFQWFIGRIFCASRWCKVSFSLVLSKGNYSVLVLSIWASFRNSMAG